MRAPLRRRWNTSLFAAGALLVPLGFLPPASAAPAETTASAEVTAYAEVARASATAGGPGAEAAGEAQAETLTVAEAINAPEGTEASVQGYVVGQPISTESVVTSDFPNDYALALADSPDETDTAQMLYVQIPSDFRAEYGLQSNPDLLESGLTATGAIEAYFAHDGLKSVTGFTEGEPAPDPEPDPEPDPDPEPEPDPGIPDGYYDEAEGKTGDELKNALHGIISESTVLSYDETWDVLKETDEDPNNPDNVLLLYSGRSQDEDGHGGEVGDWNREHVWAKSHGDFGTSPGAGTDVHHLRPTDMQVNSTRGNKDFDNGGDEVDGAPGNFTDEDSWEPRDEVKGDVARMIFYMAVRYEGNGDGPDLELNDQVDNGSAPAMGRVSVLLEWHAADPPDTFEQNRNNVIFEDWQHNRNPFIDNPEWVTEIW